MIYASLDIETTGLNSQECDVLEIGVYIEDTNKIVPREQLPCFHCYVDKLNYRGEPYALAMNAHILKKIIDLRNNQSFDLLKSPETIAESFGRFVCKYTGSNKIIAGGKNVMGFDLPFIRANIPNWDVAVRFHHRHVDPGMLFFDPQKDMVPPDMSQCKVRAGLSEHVSHEALDDAWDVIQLIRSKYSLK